MAAALIVVSAAALQASHVINSTGKAGAKILITDMFWNGDSCSGQDLKFEIVTAPQNGSITQEKVKEALDIKKLKIKEATCDGKVLTISYVYYQSKPGFAGKDEFTVRWTSVGLPNPGQTREKKYTVTIK